MTTRTPGNHLRKSFGLVALLAMTAGCDMLDMYDEPRYEPYEASRFFEDGKSARPKIEGTIARGQLREDEAFYTGRVGGAPVAQIPDAAYVAAHRLDRARRKTPLADLSPVETRKMLLERGRRQFDIYCSVCHGKGGAGDGMIVERGFRKPPAFDVARLRSAPAGHFYDVITQGLGVMPSYAVQLTPADRWAIVAYLRALQLRTDARSGDVPEDFRAELEASPREAAP